MLFLVAMGATLGIGFRDPRVEYGYECAVFLVAACWGTKAMPLIPGLSLLAIGSWGFVQIGLGASVYRFATLQSSLRFLALAATAWVAFRAFGSRQLRIEFLRLLVWFGVAIAVVSVLAYFTSPGKILWAFDAPYPDVWGPFLSRNNFAQFLELTMPVALWFALQEREGTGFYLCSAAVMLASGFASASRAGSGVLVLEAAAMLWVYRGAAQVKRTALGLIFATALFAAMPGVGAFVGRLAEPDPYQERREIAQSTLEMIGKRPWAGFGLGTFATAYPEFATFDVGKSVEHAHNDWLEWAAEGGIPWAGAWLVLALWAGRQASHAGWGIGILGCYLHALVDYPFARVGISGWIFILIGMLAASDLREVRRRVH